MYDAATNLVKFTRKHKRLFMFPLSFTDTDWSSCPRSCLRNLFCFHFSHSPLVMMLLLLFVDVLYAPNKD